VTLASWNITDPADIDVVQNDVINDIKSMFLARVTLEHNIGGGVDDTGYHRQVTMIKNDDYDGADLNLDPVYHKIEDEVGVLYTKDVDGITELFYLCKIDTELGIPEHHHIQLTSAGGVL